MNAPAHTSFDEALYLTELAYSIIGNGPGAALHCNLSTREASDWTRAAQRYIDWQGDDDGDFAGMTDEHFNPVRDSTWALDSDFLRDERVYFGMGGVL
jgi:hypothetical protein